MDKDQWQKKGAGHRQRLRDRFLQHGLQAFTDQDILELLFSLGTPRKDCKDPAREALATFGSLAAVLEAPQQELEAIKGLGPKNSFAVHFIHGVARRYLEHRLEGKNFLRSSQEVAEYLIHSMRDLKKEIFKVIFMDAQHGIICSEILSQGTITSNTVYPREILKKAFQYNAAAMVIAHNHPSGSQSPSQADHELTSRLYLAASLVHVNLLDHLIIAGSGKPYSFADHGLMAKIKQQCNQTLKQT